MTLQKYLSEMVVCFQIIKKELSFNTLHYWFGVNKKKKQKKHAHPSVRAQKRLLVEYASTQGRMNEWLFVWQLFSDVTILLLQLVLCRVVAFSADYNLLLGSRNFLKNQKVLYT